MAGRNTSTRAVAASTAGISLRKRAVIASVVLGSAPNVATDVGAQNRPREAPVGRGAGRSERSQPGENLGADDGQLVHISGSHVPHGQDEMTAAGTVVVGQALEDP